MVTDSIADFIIRIKNGNQAKNQSIFVPQTKLVDAVAVVLEKEGFIGTIAKRKKKNRKYIEINLNYGENKEPRVSGVKRISKPSRRLYVGSKDLKPFRNNFGVSIFSTPKGIMTGREAKKSNVGGEHLFNIW